MSSTRDACAATLETLTAHDGMLGACLISRDGLPVLEKWPHPADLDTIAAMGAALMGAAETSLLEFGDRDLETVLVVSRNMRLVVLGVDEELLLLAAMDRTLPIEAFDETLHEALEQINGILQEA